MYPRASRQVVYFRGGDWETESENTISCVPHMWAKVLCILDFRSNHGRMTGECMQHCVRPKAPLPSASMAVGRGPILSLCAEMEAALPRMQELTYDDDGDDEDEDEDDDDDDDDEGSSYAPLTLVMLDQS